MAASEVPKTILGNNGSAFTGAFEKLLKKNRRKLIPGSTNLHTQPV